MNFKQRMKFTYERKNLKLQKHYKYQKKNQQKNMWQHNINTRVIKVTNEQNDENKNKIQLKKTQQGIFLKYLMESRLTLLMTVYVHNFI